jgi:hypothetical protein
LTSGPRIIDASGSPRELGRVQGEELRSVIATGIRRWFDVVEPHSRMSGDAFVASFLGATDFVAAIERHAPELLEEVRGIAEGSGQSFDVILAYQMMDEEWAYRVALARSRRASVEACSAVGVLREGSSLVAQNMDLPSHYDGTQALLRLRPDGGPAVMVFTPAGMIGTTGLNSAGVGVCVNAMFQVRHASSGLPVGFVLRAMLRKDSAADAIALLKSVPHATGQNYVVGDPESIADYEASPRQVREVPAKNRQVAHTNHPLVNDDLDPGGRDDPDSTTIERLKKLEADLSRLGGNVTADDVKRTLSDRSVPVCVPRGSTWMTLGSLVMELAARPVLHYAPGPPADTPYTRVDFN